MEQDNIDIYVGSQFVYKCNKIYKLFNLNKIQTLILTSIFRCVFVNKSLKYFDPFPCSIFNFILFAEHGCHNIHTRWQNLHN